MSVRYGRVRRASGRPTRSEAVSLLSEKQAGCCNSLESPSRGYLLAGRALITYVQDPEPIDFFHNCFHVTRLHIVLAVRAFAVWLSAGQVWKIQLEEGVYVIAGQGVRS